MCIRDRFINNGVVVVSKAESRHQFSSRSPVVLHEITILIEAEVPNIGLSIHKLRCSILNIEGLGIALNVTPKRRKQIVCGSLIGRADVWKRTGGDGIAGSQTD